MGLILDTNVLIEGERKGAKTVDFGKWASYGDAFISVITVSELLAGVHLAKNEKQRLRRSAFVEGVLTRIPAIEFTTEIARIHSELFADLWKKGKMIGAHDLIISATALAHGHAVLTDNVGEFRRVPGLEVVAYPG
jgi:predicted nucleic acid-binding protein